MSATSTLPATRSQRPRFALVAARTAKPFRPAQAEQILPAGLLAAESSFEFRQCPRIVLTNSSMNRHTTYCGYLSQVDTPSGSKLVANCAVFAVFLTR